MRCLFPVENRGLLAVELFGEAFGEVSGPVVQVPVEGARQIEPLRKLQAECVDVGDVEREARDLHAFSDAKFARLLDQIDHVRP